MWSRLATAVGLLLTLATFASAQNPRAYSRALPPDASALSRLNLRTEWTLYLPVDGSRDAIELIQTFDNQIFIQTRNGLLMVVDARTGQLQWSAALGNGGQTNTYPVAVNREFVFVMNVTRLYAFYRSNGVTEFVVDLGSVPTAGLAADDTAIYCLVVARPGTAGVQRIVTLDLPQPIAVVDPSKPRNEAGKATNPADAIAGRYPASGANRALTSDNIERRAGGGTFDAPTGGMAGSRTPSLAVVSRLSPPYTMEGGPFSPSVSIVPSLRQPYHLRDDGSHNLQKTPSLGTIPPSVAAALALSDLRPRGVVPPLRWEYGLTNRVLFTPSQTHSRLWIATDSKAYLALSKLNKETEVIGALSDRLAASPAQFGMIAYVPLMDGTVLAVDLDVGNLQSGLVANWRVNLGGVLNRTPMVTKDAVFLSGDNSGVARVNRANGQVIWRTEPAADRIIGVNQDFAYIRDRQGRLLIYDANRATDPSTQRAIPLTSLNLAEFNIPVVNTVSDRVYLAADNGLLVCVRDASAKYASPVRMAPINSFNPIPRAGTPGAKDAPKDSMPPNEAMPKDKDAAMPKDKDGQDPKKN